MWSLRSVSTTIRITSGRRSAAWTEPESFEQAASSATSATVASAAFP
jgi:hypothetical protein